MRRRWQPSGYSGWYSDRSGSKATNWSQSGSVSHDGSAGTALLSDHRAPQLPWSPGSGPVLVPGPQPRLSALPLSVIKGFGSSAVGGGGMAGPAIPIAVIAGFVLFFSSGIYRRGRALRSRGIRTRARCVSSRSDDGGTELLVQFSTEAGTKRASVGPFKWAPASVGGSVEVIHDPQDLSNVLTPTEMTTGRTAFLLTVGSSLLLLLCTAAVAIDLFG
ncbi:DUF3592 domain-containing protein [Streptomyces sp. NPDC001508]|uniref:DUF3592 domain-containing protein n=1 Tax=Streptomyces sp. NPDC001508 TaxID=3154656 RepID=UPI003330E7D4